MRRPGWNYFSPLLCLFAINACRNHHQMSIYQVAPVERRTLVVAATGQGTVQPIDSVNIRSRTAGEVIGVYAAVGDQVHRGQKLVQIDPRIPQDDVQTTQAQLGVARAALTTIEDQLGKAKELYQSRSISEQEYDSVALMRDTARAGLVRAQTAVDNARIALTNAEIDAPGDGVVLAVQVNDGMVIPSTTFSADSSALLTVGDIDTVEVVALVNEVQIASLHDGMEALVTVDAFPDSNFVGKVNRIEPQSLIQNQETDFPVHVLMPNPRHTLKPGMNAEIAIETGERDSVLAVPYAALRTSNDVRSAANLLGLSMSDLAGVRGAGGGGRGGQGRDSTARRGTGRVGAPGAQGGGGGGRSPNGASPGTGAGPLDRSQFRTQSRSFFVFTRQNRDIKVTPIKTGVTDLEWAEVRSGLSDKDTVLILPSQSLVQNIQDMQQRTQRVAGLPGVSGGGGGGRR
jgi:HlyD family secretion protein